MAQRVRVSRKRMLKQLDIIGHVAETLPKTDLAELERVAKISSVVDGFPAGGGAKGSNDVANPTLAAVVVRLSNRKDEDYRQMSAEQVSRSIEEAATALIRAQRSLDVFNHQAEDAVGRPTLPECICCYDIVLGKGHDRLRSGFCPACYTAWTRTKTAERGRMDRQIFMAQRRSELFPEEPAAKEPA